MPMGKPSDELVMMMYTQRPFVRLLRALPPPAPDALGKADLVPIQQSSRSKVIIPTSQKNKYFILVPHGGGVHTRWPRRILVTYYVVIG